MGAYTVYVHILWVFQEFLSIECAQLRLNLRKELGVILT